MTETVNELKVFQGGVRLPAAAAAGLMMQCDSAGNMTWVKPPGIAYSQLVAADAPVNGWDLQDAAGVGSLAATYGAQALSVLSGVTSGGVSNPLYPGAKSIHFGGTTATDNASTAAAGALTTYQNMTMEIWVYVPAKSVMGSIMFIGKAAATTEGFGAWLGDTNGSTNSASWVSWGTLQPGVSYYGGSAGASLGNGAIVSQQLSVGWHHLCLRTGEGSLTLAELFVDGLLVGNLPAVQSGHDHTSSERTTIGNYTTAAGAGMNSAAVQFAHAYVYNKRLSNAKIRARSDLVTLLGL
jgi:hypothetical protein